MNRNTILGIVNMVIGGIFLSISGFSVIATSAFTNDIYQEICDPSGCRPMADIALDAAIVTGIIGGIVTSIGLFLFLYGIKRQGSKASMPTT